MEDAEVAEGLGEGTGDGDGDGFEFDKVDFEHAIVFAGEAFDVGDGGFELFAAKAHGGWILDEAGVGVVAKFGEEGGEGVSAGEVLYVFACEFVVFFKHVPSSIFHSGLQFVGLD